MKKKTPAPEYDLAFVRPPLLSRGPLILVFAIGLLVAGTGTAFAVSKMSNTIGFGEGY